MVGQIVKRGIKGVLDMTTSKRTKQKGMAAVEFGFVVPVLMMLVFGIAEFGVAFYREIILTGAVRDGARVGIVATTPRATSAQIQQEVKDSLADVGWDAAPAVVTVTGAGGASGTSLTVQASYPTSFAVMKKLIPMPGVAVDAAGNATVQAKIVMQLE